MSSSWYEWGSWQCLFFLPLGFKVGADNTFTLNNKKKNKAFMVTDENLN